MSLTYDGIIHRSLEEQVRYDAEQIQLLKQADVTINQNLHTVNTEINGKLTKPANPTAESAVTMLADGTVGTKPLSEIGGRKLYRHYIQLGFYNGGVPYVSFYFSLYSNYNLSYNYSTLPRDNKYISATLDGRIIGSVSIKISGDGQYPTIDAKGAILDQVEETVKMLNISYNGNEEVFSDIVTEL